MGPSEYIKQRAVPIKAPAEPASAPSKRLPGVYGPGLARNHLMSDLLTYDTPPPLSLALSAQLYDRCLPDMSAHKALARRLAPLLESVKGPADRVIAASCTQASPLCDELGRLL